MNAQTLCDSMFNSIIILLNVSFFVVVVFLYVVVIISDCAIIIYTNPVYCFVSITICNKRKLQKKTNIERFLFSIPLNGYSVFISLHNGCHQ